MADHLTDDLLTHLQFVGSCREHEPLRVTLSPEDAALWHERIKYCTPKSRHEHYRWLALNDLFFLTIYILHRADLNTSFHFDRCKEIMERRTNTLDFWARGSAKSSLGTFALTVQDILRNPEITICIFSHTNPAAKKFLRVIKQEFETNDELKALFPEILYNDPKRQSPKWSEDLGIVVKRKSNRGESTVECSGLVDGMPTGRHYSDLVYDDVIPDYPTEEMIPKITAAWELSLALKAAGNLRFRVYGTFYDVSDTYQVMLQRNFGYPRIHSVNDPNIPFTPEELATIRNSVSPRMYCLQYLLDVEAANREEHVGFDPAWIRYYKDDPPLRSMNIYMLVDPAGKSRESNSMFALWVVGLLPPRSIYLLDAVLDKLDLGERARSVVEMHRKYYQLGANILKVGYESYGMQGDVEYIRELMQREHYIFPLVQLSGTGKSKDDRIEMLIPDFRAGNLLLPARGIKYKPRNSEETDIVKYFIEREYRNWPAGRQKDLLDALARIKDPAMMVVWPRRWMSRDTEVGNPWGAGAGGSAGGWQSE